MQKWRDYCTCTHTHQAHYTTAYITDVRRCHPESMLILYSKGQKTVKQIGSTVVPVF